MKESKSDQANQDDQHAKNCGTSNQYPARSRQLAFSVWPGCSGRSASAVTLRCPAPLRPAGTSVCRRSSCPTHPASLRSSRHFPVPAFVACDSPCPRPTPASRGLDFDRYASTSRLAEAQSAHPCAVVRLVRRIFVSRRKMHPTSPSRSSSEAAHRSVATSCRKLRSNATICHNSPLETSSLGAKRRAAKQRLPLLLHQYEYNSCTALPDSVPPK